MADYKNDTEKDAKLELYDFYNFSIFDWQKKNLKALKNFERTKNKKKPGHYLKKLSFKFKGQDC